MADIQIQGGDTETAARELAAAIREIFAVDPVRSTSGASHTPGTRGLAEVALIALALPPAIHSARDILTHAKFTAGLKRLIAKITDLRKSTKASFMIDPGDGRHIPLEEASHDDIIAALKAVEDRLRH